MSGQAGLGKVAGLVALRPENYVHQWIGKGRHGGEMKSSAKPGELPLMTPRQIYERLSKYVIGQEKAKRAVAVAAYNHLKRTTVRRYKRASALRKSNILMVGPTGCGKTHIARNLAEILSVPLAIADATEFTEAGYYGKDVEMMVSDLLLRADSSVEDTERGIIFIDEIDKIARRTHGGSTGAGNRDIGGEGVQQALLKMLEGREISVPIGLTQSWAKHDFVQVDTSDILFICAGTFSDLYAYRSQRSLGFGSSVRDRQAARKRVSVKELVDYGMLSELLGRLPVIVELDELGEDDLFQVLTVPPDSLLREYRESLAIEGIDLAVSDTALREVARYARDKRLGARGLRSIIEELMADIMFLAPERRGGRVALDVGTVRRRLAAISPGA
jgi:ATP-dependent Clp protease ATP-binding subunit ClpX